jgi:capsular exopolysaccharide synthesis family protein
MISDPFSRLSEVITTVRMGLMRSAVDRGAKVALITSSIPGEGKSTAAMLLAASSAPRQGTVLVDCDFRRRYVSVAFGLADKPGLAEILSGGVELSNATYFDKKSSVAVIAAGTVPPNPADLFSSQRIRDLLRSLREHYRFIVLDAPPLLPVADAAVLANAADEILVVVEWSRTPRMSVEEAVKTLAVEARHSVGIVINKVDYARLRTYGYGYGYGYNYGYYYRRLERYYHRS